jgi:hypothetical protein
MPGRVDIEIENRHDRWRYVCPMGHRSWEPTNHHFWCKLCANHEDDDGTFDALLDRKTDELLQREEVRLLTEAGPYDRDVDRKKSV